MKNKLIGKILGLGAVIAALAVMLNAISGVVQDRMQHQGVAIESIGEGLGGAQQIKGPLLRLSCTENRVLVDRQEATSSSKASLVQHTASSNRVVYRVPTTHRLKGNLMVEPRKRGIFKLNTYSLSATSVASWAVEDLKWPTAGRETNQLGETVVICSVPVVLTSVSDARGIRKIETLAQLGAKNIETTVTPLNGMGFQKDQPSTGGWAVELSRPIAVDGESVDTLTVKTVFDLAGSKELKFVPAAKDTQVELTGNWPDPSFNGQFLPHSRDVTTSAFSAKWAVSSLASRAPASLASSGLGGAHEAFGVGLFDAVNNYTLSDRATKYGLLFVFLTVMVVGLFEVLKQLRVHPIQYLLIGIAVAVFFLLLAALSEHLGFDLAYLVAAGACVTLLTGYASSILKSWLRGLPFGCIVASLYGVLFVVLQQQDAALALGSVVLFVALASAMALTRHVDWYQFATSEPNDDALTTT